MRPLVRIDQLWTLATTWYSTRLQAQSRRPKPDEMRGIFASLGLEGDFWDPTSDSFGSPASIILMSFQFLQYDYLTLSNNELKLI